MKRLGSECVYLDISHKSRAFIKAHFPTIYGEHQVDECGRTDIAGLYAIGEVAYSGLHGANRMASNSLLECLVFSRTAASDIGNSITTNIRHEDLPRWDESQVTDSDEDIVVAHNWDELRRFMWDYVGIVRTNKRLERALNRTSLLKREINEYYGNYKVSGDLLELLNLVLVAELIIRSAMQRKESRGLHFTLDYPDADEKCLKPTILIPEVNRRKKSKVSLVTL